MTIKKVKTTDKRVFRVETDTHLDLTRKWGLRLRDAADQDPTKLAFVWDDVVGRWSGGYRYNPFRVIWPTPAPLLFEQADLCAHGGVNQTEMKRMLGRGDIASLDDVSGALRVLARTQPDLIGHVADILRHTEVLTAPVYTAQEASVVPQNKALRISVIVNYRDRPDLMKDCLTGLAAQKIDGTVELLLINNQSTPEARSEIYEQVVTILPDYFEVIHLDYNEPFNKSVQDNLGAETATGDVVVFFNNDAELLTDDCLQALSDWALEPGVACAGPRILGDADRMVSNGVFARVATDTQPAIIRESEFEMFEFGIRPTVGISFACAAASKATLADVGPLDTEVFISQYNDADFFIRALRMGYVNLQVGSVSCRHEPGASEARTKDKTFALLAKFVERFPEVGDYAGIDFDVVKMRSTPDFEPDSAAAKHMKKIRNWRRMHSKLARAKAMIKRLANRLFGRSR